MEVFPRSINAVLDLCDLFAVGHMTRMFQMAKELGPKKIRVNTDSGAYIERVN